MDRGSRSAKYRNLMSGIEDSKNIAEAALKAGISYQQALVRLFPPIKSEVRVLCQQMNLRLDKDMYLRLLETSVKQKTHHSELIRTFIEWGLESCE